MKTSRKILSLLLALVMIFSMVAVSTFAADEVEYCVREGCGGVCEWRFESVYGCEENMGLYCKICGTRKMGETRYNHNYYEYSRIEPTCIKEGASYQACANDGCYATRVEVLPIVTNAHSYGEWFVTDKATCVATGSKYATCGNTVTDEAGNVIRCGYKNVVEIPVDSSAHVFEGEWKERVAPTCEADGEAYRVCSLCDKAEETKAIPAHSATWEEYDRKEATCTTEGISYVVCTKCNDNSTVVIPVNDNHAWMFNKVTLAPTCTEEGEELWICRWHNEVTKTVKIEANGHSFTNYISDGNAKCGVDGTKTAKCDNCDVTDTVADEGSALTHTESRWLILSGDCAKGEAVTAYKNCVYCKTEMVAPVTFNPGYHPNRRLITVPATCTTDGYTGNICADCGDGEKTVIPASHTLPDEWKIVKGTSCSEEGLKIKQCASCDYFEQQSIEKIPHVYIILDPGVEVTCLENGYTPFRHCTKCGYDLPSEEIIATGHNDANNDGCCDKCYVYFIETENGIVDCDCFCHNQDGLAQFVFKIVNFICRILGANKECPCGKLHYEGEGLFGDLFG